MRTSPCAVFTLLLAGCLGSSTFGEGGAGDGPVAGVDGGVVASDGGVAPPPSPVCLPAPHLGIGGIDLAADRLDSAIGVDRARVKPHGALGSELTRVLAVTPPASLAAAAPTFGAEPARWFTENESSAMVLYTIHQVAFEACLAFTATAPDYAATPTSVSATIECTSLCERAWSRTPDAQELGACVQLAAVDTAAEADPRRRWAYTCAAVLTSASFLTY